MAIIVGIDGCPSGWLCLIKDLLNNNVEARIIFRIDELLELDPEPLAAMVDVPIGLTDCGPRDCDLQARRYLKRPRSSSVFPAPIRPVLPATTHAEASQIGKTVDGRKLSKQTWAILPKIKEVDSFIRTDVMRQTWLREVHPELCFWAWNDNNAMKSRKKSSKGKAERETLVKAVYADAYSAARSTPPRGRYGNDDLLDAFASLWTAERFIDDKALIISAGVDSSGVRMEMIA